LRPESDSNDRPAVAEGIAADDFDDIGDGYCTGPEASNNCGERDEKWMKNREVFVSALDGDSGQETAEK
jgi:hypothetical protein